MCLLKITISPMVECLVLQRHDAVLRRAAAVSLRRDADQNFYTQMEGMVRTKMHPCRSGLMCATAPFAERRKHMVVDGKRRKKAFLGRVEPYLYLLPVMAVFGLFVYFPFVRTTVMSLSIVNSMGEIVRFAGLRNYIQLFQSESFWSSLWLTFSFTIRIVPLQILFGIILALLADNRKKKSSPIRVVFALPMAVSTACASIIWLLLFNASTGLVNYIIGRQINWLSNGSSAMNMIIIVTCWLTMGVNFIYSYSGLQTVPNDLYESAAIDGAGYLRMLRHITLPQITPTLFFLLITNTISAFQTFTQVQLMTEGGPGGSTEVFAYSIYKAAFLSNRWGYACAQSIVFLLILLAIALIQFRIEKKGVFYQ